MGAAGGKMAGWCRSSGPQPSARRYPVSAPLGRGLLSEAAPWIPAILPCRHAGTLHSASGIFPQPPAGPTIARSDTREQVVRLMARRPPPAGVNWGVLVGPEPSGIARFRPAGGDDGPDGRKAQRAHEGGSPRGELLV